MSRWTFRRARSTVRRGGLSARYPRYCGAARDGLHRWRRSPIHLGAMDETRAALCSTSDRAWKFRAAPAARLLRRVRAGLEIGDAMLLGVDLVKDEATLVAAYDDAQGVTRPLIVMCSCASTVSSTRTSMRKHLHTARLE